MKNVMIIDGAMNCEYAVYQFTDEQFKMIFPGDGQNIEFIEDLEKRLTEAEMIVAFKDAFTRRLHKSEANGLHGTIFYELEEKKPFYPSKNDAQMVDAITGTRPLREWHTMPDIKDRNR